MEGRYLLGVEPTDRVEAFLRTHTRARVAPDVLRRRNAAAEAIREARPFSPGAVRPAPDDAEAHWARVRGRPLFQTLFGSRQVTFAWVDIATLIPTQPHINFTHALTRVGADLPPDAVLELTLPAEREVMDLWGGLTRTGGTPVLTLGTRDPNVGISEARLDHADGLKIVFTIGKTAVFVQVIRHQGRFLVRDGTHRAVGLLARGHTHLPAVVLSCDEPDEIPPFLSRTLLLGPHPPVLADFLEPALVYAHPWDERTKVIRIQAEEFALPAP